MCAVVVVRRILGSVRNPAQFVVGAFVVVILLGAVLLRLPIAADEGSLSWHDSLFWSTSATTITGLVTVDISAFSLFGELVLLAAQHSSKVFVGRGAQHFLPAERGVSVFLVAPLTMRIARIQDVRGCSEAEARRYIRDTDQTRRDLIKSHFNREIDDPHLYDLVINRTQIDSDAAAELVVNECRRRFSLT